MPNINKVINSRWPCSAAAGGEGVLMYIAILELLSFNWSSL